MHATKLNQSQKFLFLRVILNLKEMNKEMLLIMFEFKENYSHLSKCNCFEPSGPCLC